MVSQTQRGHLWSNGAVHQALFPDVPLRHLELGRADVMLLHEGFTVEAGHRARVAILPELCGNDGFDATAVWPVALVGDEVHPLTDQHGHCHPHPARRERLTCLVADQWNLLELDLDEFAGMTVRLALDCPAGQGRLAVQWLGTHAVPPEPTSPVDHVRTTRGTNSAPSFSRGNTLPAVALPHGFNLLTPVTDARSRTWLYQWAPEGGPRLEALAVSHQPSPWINDRAGVQLMGWHGTPHVDPARRSVAFSHDDEVDRPHHYRVALADGMVAEVTPTDHGGLFRFTMPGDEPCGVVLDMPQPGRWQIAPLPDGRLELRGRMEPAPGHGRRQRDPVGFCYCITRQRARLITTRGRRQAAVLQAEAGEGRVVEVALATSFISVEQARHNLDLEIGEASFDEVRGRAEAAWKELLGRLELPAASTEQRIVAWSNLARLHLWPSAMHENTGTAEHPHWVHASPFRPIGARARLRQRWDRTASPVVDGRLYVNNGYWDTYRTCWPAFGLLFPDLAGDLVDGLLPAWRESGWMGRWSAPGHVDSMVGTSSDVIFADAAAHGIGFDELAGHDSAVRNASCPGPDATVGRKGLGTGRFLGWIPSEVDEGLSWSVENALCDAALARWSASLADRAESLGIGERVDELRAHAQWFTNRALGIGQLFDPATGFLRGRRTDGSWSTPALDPERWGDDYTETTAWGMSVSIPQDGALLASLHGGEEALARHLDRLLATPERADHRGGYGGVIHEMREARALRLGQFALSNQPAHHIGFMPLHAGQPWRSQQVVRDALERGFVGSEIGQGYPGDEDNGEMSAWWLFAAMGLYPLAPGSGEYVLGTPLTPMTWQRPEGRLSITTRGTGHFVASVTRNGEPWTACSIGVEDLRGDVELCIELSDQPTAWGADSRPASLSTGPLGTAWGPHRRDRSALARWSGPSDHQARALVDDRGRQRVPLAAGMPLEARWPEPWQPRLLTLTCPDPGRVRVAVTLIGRDDEPLSEVVLSRDARWPQQTMPFELPPVGEVAALRLRPLDDVLLCQLEVY